MSQGNDQFSKSKKYDFEQIKSVIENGFMHDWAISIEYIVKTAQNETKWEKWDKSLYAVKDPDKVMEVLKECCRNNPECSMKLICERFSPECRLVYCVHRKNTPSRET